MLKPVAQAIRLTSCSAPDSSMMPSGTTLSMPWCTDLTSTCSQRSRTSYLEKTYWAAQELPDSHRQESVVGLNHDQYDLPRDSQSCLHPGDHSGISFSFNVSWPGPMRLNISSLTYFLVAVEYSLPEMKVELRLKRLPVLR